MMQFHAVLIRILAAVSKQFFLPRPLFERAVVKAVITDTRLITVRIPVNNRTSYDYIRNQVQIRSKYKLDREKQIIVMKT